MTNPAHSTDGAARALAPVLFGLVVLALFMVGLLLGGNAEDDYTRFAGLTLAAFGLFVGGRYINRLLP